LPQADPCIHYLWDLTSGEYSITSVHTDDVFSGLSSDKEADDMVRGFKIWELKDIKDKNFLVRLTINHLSNGSIAISQVPFFQSAFHYFGIINDLHPIYTPLPPNYSLSPDETQMEEDIIFMKGKLYHAILGCCWWGASCTCPNIIVRYSILSSVQNGPMQGH
jgi:hypothetical protein